MKRFVLFITMVFILISANAITKTWSGVSGSNWNAGGNWTPTGVPAAADDVIVNLSVTIVIDISPISINSLTITNISTVLFDCPGTRNITLNSISAATPGLLIDAGSTLTIDGSNVGTNNSTLLISGGAGVIGTINGTLIFSSTGGSRAGNSIHMDTNAGVSNYGIVTVNSGGMIKVEADAGNTQTALTPVPNIIMKNGSVYQTSRNGGSFPVGTWETTSLAKATSVGANGPTFNGDVYGNLEYNCPLQTNIVFFNKHISFNDVNMINTNRSDAGGEIRVKTSSAGGLWTMTINGNLTIAANARLVTTAANVTAGNGGKIHLKGNLINGGTIKADGLTSTINELELNGIANQNVSVTDSLYGPINFIMNNAAGATLLSRLTLPYSLTLTSGKIKTDPVNILTLISGVGWSGGSSTSFVDGPARRTGTGIYYTLPIGKGSIFAPIGYYTSTNYAVTDTFTAEYFRSNPQSIYGTNYQSLAPPNNIDHISYVEYWSLVNNTITQSSRVILTVTEYSFCTDSNMDSTFVVRYNSVENQWKYWGNGSTFLGPPVGSYMTGTIDSDSSRQLMGIFTLATSLPFAANPLPINLISFDVSKLTNTKSSINWELAACCSAASRFEIQRAGANKNFASIGTVGGSETNKSYNYFDNGLKNGINYYRLKMIDADGKITYSRTVAVMNGVNGLLLTSLIPTIVTNTAELTIASSGQHKLDLIIVDMQGRVMLKRSYTITAGNTNIGLQLNGLAAGIYQLTGISAEGKTNTIRFIKQ